MTTCARSFPQQFLDHARRQIQDLGQQRLNAVDALGQAQCQRGRQRYARLAAKNKSARRPAQKGRSPS